MPVDQRLISVIVPMFNEQENVRPMVAAVASSLAGRFRFEAIFVDDGSTDGTVTEIRRCVREYPEIQLVRLARNYGQTAAMQAGLDHASGDIVVTIDGDMQNDPRDIPALVAKLDEGFDLVVGNRVHRRDGSLRTLASWVAGALTRKLTGLKIRDTGCTLKAYSAELSHRLHLYSDLHRFIPAVAAAVAAARIAQVPVRHRPRLHGRSKYGFSRVFKVAADLITIVMIKTFRDRPMRMFAGAAMGSFAFAVLCLSAWIVTAKLYHETDTLVFPTAALLFGGLTVYLTMLGIITESILDRFLDLGSPRREATLR